MDNLNMDNLLKQMFNVKHVYDGRSKSRRATAIKRQNKQVKNLIKNTVCIFEANMPHVEIYNLTGDKLEIANELRELIPRTPSRIKIYHCILGREKNGKIQILYEEVIPEYEIKRIELADFSYKLHDTMIEEYNDSPRASNFITAGWISTHCDNKLTNEFMIQLFENEGSFLHKSIWQSAIEER